MTRGIDRSPLRTPGRHWRRTVWTALAVGALTFLPGHAVSGNDARSRSVWMSSEAHGASLSLGLQDMNFRAIERSSLSTPDEGTKEIIAQLQASLQNVEDLEQHLRMDIINVDNDTTTRAEGRLRGKMPHLFRIDFTAPDMLAGMTIIVDVSKNEARQYQPITEQIIVQPWDQLAQERGLEFDLEHWLGVPDPEKFHLQRVADVTINETGYIVLEGRPLEPTGAARYEFFIHPERWWVEGLRLYDDRDRLTFSALMEDVTFNQGLDEQRLRALPSDADIVNR